MAKKKLKVGFDLDGIIVDKPFFMPKPLIEWLYRTHNGNGKKYRYPKFKPEIWLRQISHHYFFRHPINKNLSFIKKLSKNKRYQLFVISGRYSFLKEKTNLWFKKHNIDYLFEQRLINLKDEQPHIFKEKMIKKLNIDFFYDDSLITINYLKKNVKNTKCFLVDNYELTFPQ